jgi:hypothetical protein
MKKYQRIDTISWNDKNYKVSWTFYPSTPDVWHLPNGDPGYPGSPEEADIESMIDDNNKTLDINKLSDTEMDEIQKLLFNIIPDDCDE